MKLRIASHNPALNVNGEWIAETDSGVYRKVNGDKIRDVEPDFMLLRLMTSEIMTGADVLEDCG